MNTQEPWQSPAPDILGDITAFHQRYGLRQPHGKQSVREHNEDSDRPQSGIALEEWELRHRRLIDEMGEYTEAVEFNCEEEILDALVDIVYIAIGTAYRRGWDFAEAWKRVHGANMAKERGKPNNSKYGSGFDIVKPEGWLPASLADLVGQSKEEGLARLQEMLDSRALVEVFEEEGDIL